MDLHGRNLVKTMFDDKFWIIPAALIAVFVSVLIALPFIYFSERADIANMVARCEARNGVLLKNTYRVGKTATNTWVCVKPDIIIEMQ